MSLIESFKGLQAALEPLGVEIGTDVRHLWRDRVRTGQEPIPESALRDMIAWAEKQIAERE